MGYTEHWCEGCNAAHDAAFWYYQRVAPGGLAYLCGEKYNTMTEKFAWIPLEPGDEPPQHSGEDIRYCQVCDTPLSSPREYEQGYHDGCQGKAKPAKRPGTGKQRTRRGSRR